jgi:hypothetical protein
MLQISYLILAFEEKQPQESLIHHLNKVLEHVEHKKYMNKFKK